MGYVLSSSRVLKKNIDAGWEVVDLSAVTISQIFSTYRKVTLVLTHTSISGTFYLDLYSALDTVGLKSTSQTISEWLLWLGNRSLPVSTQEPNLQESIVKYADAWIAGYRIKPVSSNASPDAQLPRAEKRDLLLTKTNVPYVDNWEYLLAVVNGYVHRVGGSSHGFYVIDGGMTGYIANNNLIGLLSFKDVGKIKTHQITHDMLHKVRVDQRYSDYVHVKLPYSTVNKTVLLVVGGYLHVLDNTYRQLSPTLLRINVNKLNLVERIYESRDKIDLSSLNIDFAPHKPDQYAVEEILSDETVVGYLTLPQSFLIIVDKQNFFVRKHALETARLPGRFIGPAPIRPLPIMSYLGGLVNYHPINDDGRVVYAGYSNQKPNYLYQTQQWLDQHSVDDQRYGAEPWRFSDGVQLEIGVFGN